MKINRTKNSGYLEGETALHKLKAKTKITASLFLILGSGICNRCALMGVGLLSVVGVLCCRVPVKKIASHRACSLFLYLVQVLTTSKYEWISGLEKLLGPLSQHFFVIQELLAVAVIAVKFFCCWSLLKPKTTFRASERQKANSAIKSYVNSFTLFWSLLSGFFLT